MEAVRIAFFAITSSLVLDMSAKESIVEPIDHLQRFARRYSPLQIYRRSDIPSSLDPFRWHLELVSKVVIRSLHRVGKGQDTCVLTIHD